MVQDVKKADQVESQDPAVYKAGPGTLWVVATPIGNRSDISQRARDVLGQSALIAAEDTRHSGRLLDHLGISGRLLSVHDHNEAQRVEQIAQALEKGDDVALICDAGTPLISDPGFVLVRALRQRGCRISPVPGPCAAIAALSVAGLPTDRFFFCGFLPAKAAARRREIENLGELTATWLIYESSHRISACVDDLCHVLGADRPLVIARELSKLHEQVFSGRCGEARQWLARDANHQKGEFVVVVAGVEKASALAAQDRAWLEQLRESLSDSQLARAAAAVTGLPRREIYQYLQDHDR